MQKQIVIFLLAFFILPFVLYGNEGYYYYPDIKGDRIIFSSQGTIWMVDADGGTAKSITSSKSGNAYGILSPDGQYIAYRMSVNNNADVYLMSINGGMPRRLTYHPYSDRPVGFTKDSRYVIFVSSRSHPNYNPLVYKVSVDGGLPKEIKIGRVVHISFAEDEDFVAFNKYLSPAGSGWKRYKGGRIANIWAGTLSDMDFKQITDSAGNNTYPMIYKDRIYFVSDRNGRNNIFSMDFEGDDIKQHTFYERFDLNRPSLGDDRIVFQKAGDIYVYDISTDQAEKIDIRLPVDNMNHMPVYEDAAQWVGNYSISPEAQRALIEARGNIYIVPVKEGRAITVASSSDIRFKNPAFSNDGSKIAYFSDETGTQQLYISKAEDNAERIRLTDNLGGWYHMPVWSPDDSMIAFSDEKLALYIYDLKNKKTLLVDRSDLYQIREYSWSPCGAYLSYAKFMMHENSSIFVYDLKYREAIRITSPVSNDISPAWDPAGKYLYFLSYTHFSYIACEHDSNYAFTKGIRPHIVLLNKKTRNPLLPAEWDEENDSINDKLPIDFDRIESRIFPFPVRAGNYSNLSAVEDKIYFMDREDYKWMIDAEYYDREYFRNTLYSYNLKDKKFEEVLSAIDSYRLSQEKDQILYKRDNQYRINQDTIDLGSINLSVIPIREWNQIYNEAVRLQKLYFWAPNLGNVDWDHYADKYRELLPRIGNRSELDMLIAELVGELATGHAYIFSRPEFPQRTVNVGLLGADFQIENDKYKISKIYHGDQNFWNIISPLSYHPINEGDYILAVNGTPIKADKNIYSYFENLADRKILLTVSKDGSMENASDYTVKPVSSEYMLRYTEWVHKNRKYVQEKSQGKIGYIHIPDMVGFGLSEFYKQYYSQLHNDALIIDIRYNGGGRVSENILEVLRRELSFLRISRHASPSTSPFNVFLGHMACLINEEAGSDGDLFAEAFRMYGLGRLIGTRTWGGVVGLRSSIPFVDNGIMTVPQVRFYHPERGWIIENEGVVPDIEVINNPADYYANRDPQLDKAIEVLLDEIRDNPVQRPSVPPYPDNTMEAWIDFWKDKQ